MEGINDKVSDKFTIFYTKLACPKCYNVADGGGEFNYL